MVTTKQMMRASLVKNYTNIDLNKDFFELSYEEQNELQRFIEIFNFNVKNYQDRNELKQFYYDLQKGYRNLPF